MADVRVWTSSDRVWRVEERSGRWEIRMHTALVETATSKPATDRKLQALGGPALSEMKQT